MAKQRQWAPVIPIPSVSIAPNRISQYWRFEGLQRQKKKVPQLPGVQEKGPATPYGFVELHVPKYAPDATDAEKADAIEWCERMNKPIISHNNSIQNLIDNKSVVMSHSAKKRIINAINCLYVLSAEKTYECTARLGSKSGSKLKQKFRLNFVTLTLCCAQMHDDKYVKSEMLAAFIEKLKYHYGMKSYLWRAERQKNGRIHFHLTSNIYFPHAEIRRFWNDIQAKHGYIDAYMARGGNSNPNGTDVRKISKVRNLGAYLSKYMAKDTDSNLKPIEGRQWFLSSNLSKIKPISEIFDCDLRLELERLVGDKWKKFDYANVAYVDAFTSDLSGYPTLKRLVDNWLNEYRNNVN